MTGKLNRTKRKDTYYLGIAEAVASKSTCVRRAYGAVVVKNDEILATGYNGSPRGCINCTEAGCIREQLGVMKGDNYNLCTSVHAEMNAMLSAARQEMIGATLYIVGLNNLPELMEKDLYADPNPCLLCHRMIVNAGIERVVGRCMCDDPVTGERIPQDVELDITARTFMERLNELYDRTLSTMEKTVMATLDVAQRQKDLGADTTDLRQQINGLDAQLGQIKNARQVLIDRKNLLGAAITSHQHWSQSAAALREINDIAEKYNVPITTAVQMADPRPANVEEDDDLGTSDH